MSYKDGWAAINLQMPKRVPRTEYSLEGHWKLLKAVTGIDVNPDSPGEIKAKAARALHKAWNYDFFWSTLIGGGEFGELQTDMGHAVYAAGGVDRREPKPCPFKDPEEALRLDPWEALRRKRQKRADGEVRSPLSGQLPGQPHRR